MTPRSTATRSFRPATPVPLVRLFVAAALLCAPLCAEKNQVSLARIEITAPGEPGEQLIVIGTVFRPDGTTPAPGVVLYVYQTDATGRYATAGAAPRLRGWLRTDGEGSYEYRTIRPAPYPGQRIAAHIHTQLWGAGAPPQWNRDLLFADDPLVSVADKQESEALGRFAFVCAPRRAGDGAARCVHDLRLETSGDEFGSNTRHGISDAPEGLRP